MSEIMKNEPKGARKALRQAAWKVRTSWLPFFSKLFAAGRIKDAEKASVDEEYRSKLSAEFRMG